VTGLDFVPQALQRRKNLAQPPREAWKPPPLAAAPTPLSQVAARLRRFFDLQAGSGWNDVAHLLADAEGKVVDVGCGGQPYRELLPATVEYVGIDIADASTKFGYKENGTIFFDGGEWPAEAHNADVVLCTEVLEHVPQPAQFLDRAYRALKPGGHLVGTVPFAARWHFVPFDYWRFTPSSLKQLLEEAGFRNVQIWARGNALTVACYKAMALFLPALFPQSVPPLQAWLQRCAGAPLTPLFALLAVVANVSLQLDGGDDCLGYSILAERAA
jgi:SAM-dependent methyltransferase